MQSTATPVRPRSAFTADDLLHTPLPQLLTDVGAQLVESSITERGFTGYMSRDGDRIMLAMRAGQPAPEREMIARAMLGEALRVPMPPLPEPYQLTVL